MKVLVGVLAVLLLVLQYKLWVADGGYPAVRHLRGEVAALKAENEQLQERNRALQAEVEDLKGGLTVVEDLARDDLGMIKQGETFFQVIPQQKNSGAKAESHP